jgi:hypothetical protein
VAYDSSLLSIPPDTTGLPRRPPIVLPNDGGFEERKIGSVSFDGGPSIKQDDQNFLSPSNNFPKVEQAYQDWATSFPSTDVPFPVENLDGGSVSPSLPHYTPLPQYNPLPSVRLHQSSRTPDMGFACMRPPPQMLERAPQVLLQESKADDDSPPPSSPAIHSTEAELEISPIFGGRRSAESFPIPTPATPVPESYPKPTPPTPVPAPVTTLTQHQTTKVNSPCLPESSSIPSKFQTKSSNSSQNDILSQMLASKSTQAFTEATTESSLVVHSKATKKKKVLPPANVLPRKGRKVSSPLEPGCTHEVYQEHISYRREELPGFSHLVDVNCISCQILVVKVARPGCIKPTRNFPVYVCCACDLMLLCSTCFDKKREQYEIATKPAVNTPRSSKRPPKPK